MILLMAGLFSARQANAAENSGSNHHSWSALAAPDTGFSDADQTTTSSLNFDQNHSTSSLPTQFFANNNNGTKAGQNSGVAAGSTTQTTGNATSLFTLGPPLVDVGSSSPTNLIPSEGMPVITPEPGAFLSALLSLVILCLVLVLSGRKGRRQPQRLT